MALTILIFSTVLIAYHAMIYPLLLLTFAAAFRKPKVAFHEGRESRHPTVSLVVPAYNEERFISKKIVNLHELMYPDGKLSIVVAFDGCTDQTVSIAQDELARLGSNKITLRIAEVNAGKTAVLNREIAAARSEIVALSDVSAMLAPDSLLRLMGHFEDPSVGVVCPTYRVGGEQFAGSYWSYQCALKKTESEIASVVGAHGAFYLFRRGLWTPLPLDTINDDFILPMAIVKSGYKAIYDDLNLVTDLETSNSGKDFRRQMRIAAGNLQQSIRMASLASPARPSLAFLFLSGKGIRGFVPLLGLAAFISSIPLAFSKGAFFKLVLLGEVIILMIAAVTALDRPILPRPFGTLGSLVRRLVAGAIGCTLYLVGSRHSGWAANRACSRRS